MSDRKLKSAMALPEHTAIEPDILHALEQRLGPVHARQRIGIETESTPRVFGGGLNFFHIENVYVMPTVIRTALKISGLYWRARRNAERIALRRNPLTLPHLPPAFDGFTILHISDLHVEKNPGAMRHLMQLVQGLDYDACVMTGDFRGRTWGPFGAMLEGLREICAHLKGPIYGVLGNHDSILMVPGMEEMGIRMLLNESETLERGGQRLHLAGIDDAHYFRVDNIEKTAARIPRDEFSILLSHTPEIFRQAAHAGFDVLLGGHTHGGQICLPGSIPIILDAKLPRRLGAGAWRHGAMLGYTSRGAGCSIVPVRLNCPPEITLHRLSRA